jgi:hypothetical protein
MSDKLKLGDSASCGVVRGNNKMKDQLGIKGKFNVEHWREGKLLETWEVPNLITNEGKNHILDVQFDGIISAITTWYIGLIDLTGYSALAAADIYDEIDGTNGWDEFTPYTDPANADSAVTRPAWTPDAAASQSITNSTVVSFDITGSGTVKGLFLCGGTNAQTKSDHTAGVAHKLWNAALFTGGDRTVANTDTLKVTYTVSG